MDTSTALLAECKSKLLNVSLACLIFAHVFYFCFSFYFQIDSMSSMPGVDPNSPINPKPNEWNNEVSNNGMRKARVIYDYDGQDTTELSLMANEVLSLPVSFLTVTDFF